MSGGREAAKLVETRYLAFRDSDRSSVGYEHTRSEDLYNHLKTDRLDQKLSIHVAC